jgi:SAM-dependent methyltransferase
MAPRIVRKLAGLAPPALRRGIAGALIDLQSLPARLADPARRAEPWAFVHNVGNGDFVAAGAQIRRNLTDHVGLTGSDTVLDIGCGNGRVAEQLAPLLRDAGGYVGFDISRPAILACRRRFAGRPHMCFEHLDVWNGEYNTSGKVAERDTVFPAEDASIDLAFATSVFTHMRMPAVRRYLAESARVLRRGGRLAFTCFALEPGRERSESFEFRPFDDTSAVIDQRVPERAIGHRREVLEAAVVEVGLKVIGIFHGHWAPGADYDGGQDLIVAVKGRALRSARHSRHKAGNDEQKVMETKGPTLAAGTRLRG